MSFTILDKINTHNLQGSVSYIKNTYILSYDVNCTIENCYVLLKDIIKPTIYRNILSPDNNHLK